MFFRSGIGSGPSGMAPWTPWIDTIFLKKLDFSRFFDIFQYFAYKPIIDSLKSCFEHAK